MTSYEKYFGRSTPEMGDTMDNIVARPRYPRHNVHRQRRKIKNEKSTLGEIILKQIFVSILIFTVISIIKNINTPFADFVTTKIRSALFMKIEINSLYKGAEDLFAKITGGKQLEREDEYGLSDEIDDGKKNDESDAVAVSAQIKEANVSFIKPVDGNLSSEFGNRKHPLLGTMIMHNGIDIDASEGEGIRAALDGEILETGNSETYGKYIKIKHDNGMVTVYAHCLKLNVDKGQTIKQGDIIAEVGNTGLSVGTHLHFEIWLDGKPVNPLNYLEIPLS